MLMLIIPIILGLSSNDNIIVLAIFIQCWLLRSRDDYVCTDEDIENLNKFPRQYLKLET